MSARKSQIRSGRRSLGSRSSGADRRRVVLLLAVVAVFSEAGPLLTAEAARGPAMPLRHLRWSPSGKAIAFVGNGRSGLWTIGADGQNLRHRVKGYVTGYSWSPDGSRILLQRLAKAFEKADIGDVSLWELHLADGKVKLVREQCTQPSYSRSGNLFAAVDLSALPPKVVIRSARGVFEPLPIPRLFSLSGPAFWGPDGRSVAVVCQVEGSLEGVQPRMGLTAAILLCDIRGDGCAVAYASQTMRPCTKRSGVWFERGGRRLAYVVSHSRGCDIVVSARPEPGRTGLLRPPGRPVHYWLPSNNAFYCRWDGAHNIAVVEDNHVRIYALNPFDTKRPSPLLVSILPVASSADSLPSVDWSPTGRLAGADGEGIWVAAENLQTRQYIYKSH